MTIPDTNVHDISWRKSTCVVPRQEIILKILVENVARSNKTIGRLHVIIFRLHILCGKIYSNARVVF